MAKLKLRITGIESKRTQAGQVEGPQTTTIAKEESTVQEITIVRRVQTEDQDMTDQDPPQEPEMITTEWMKI